MAGIHSCSNPKRKRAIGSTNLVWQEFIPVLTPKEKEP
jgi:hypothetical protein